MEQPCTAVEAQRARIVMRLESLPVLGSFDPIHDRQLQLTGRAIKMIIIRAVLIFKKLGRHCRLHAVGPTVLDRSDIRTL